MGMKRWSVLSFLIIFVFAAGPTPAQNPAAAGEDLRAGRPTEIDALNGYVARRAEAQGVAAPVNRSLHTLVKLLEAGVTAA